MDKLYYREYFDVERNHWWFRGRSEILNSYIRRSISGERKLKILNVGVATGATSVMLQSFGEVTSLEYEQDCIDFIKDKVSIAVIQGSILELPFADNSFDLVCAFDVVEHVEDHVLAIRELSRVCNQGGSVLITVPAFMSLWSEHDEINHHFRRYKVGELKQLFSKESGLVVFASYFNSILFIPIFLARKISNFFRDKNKKAQSDFQKYKPGIVSSILFGILRSERKLLNKSVTFPVGVSLILHWKKND